ncbi:hypothetical protein EW146_g7332 [Bondarzewia mesenterica]|uniref:Uncharacterized protein n=1 Tax=Bondarzewia mesenterica TaxID=1095465 RepID=A0A4S4LRP7_9AGAM|nr:hypothetical protein EW146_g7332 [Bondarzewia mesenterica]
MTRPYFSPFYPGMGYHQYYWRRGGHRGLWFLFGALATLAWVKHKERERIEGSSAGCGWHYGHTRARDGTEHVRRDGDMLTQQRRDHWVGNSAAIAPVRDDEQRVDPVVRPHLPEETDRDMFGHTWDGEREKVKELGRYAGETMSELSEATLDSMLAGLQGLKARLAEHRADQQQQTEQDASEPASELPRHLV